MVKPAFIFDGRNILDHAKLRWVPCLCWVCSTRPVVESMLSYTPLTFKPLTTDLSLRVLREIGFIVYAIGKPLDPFLQKGY